MGYATSFQQSLQRGRRTMMKKKGYAMGGMMKKGYAKGGMKKKGYAAGGLKPAPNKGAAKLPKKVRNQMGFMYSGGMAMKKKGMAKGGAMMKKKAFSRGGFLAGPMKPLKIKSKGGSKGGAKGGKR